MKERRVNYRQLKESLSAPAQKVLEAFMERNQGPEDVIRHLVREGRDVIQAYAYIREVLARSLMELTGVGFRPPLRWAEEFVPGEDPRLQARRRNSSHLSPWKS